MDLQNYYNIKLNKDGEYWIDMIFRNQTCGPFDTKENAEKWIEKK